MGSFFPFKEFLPLRGVSPHKRSFFPNEVFLWMLVEDLMIMSLSICSIFIFIMTEL